MVQRRAEEFDSLLNSPVTILPNQININQISVSGLRRNRTFLFRYRLKKLKALELDDMRAE